MQRKILALLLLLAIGWLGIFLFIERSAQLHDPNKLNVVTSFYPLAFLAEQIGGDNIMLTNLTPAGAEPHEYELTPQDTITVETSDLLILNGGGLEPWSESIQKNLEPTVRVVIAGEGLATEQLQKDGQQIIDPHVWLSPKLAQQMATKIAAAMRQADPANTAFYAQRLSALETRLASLDESFSKGLATCKSRDIVTAHAAFGYLAKAYNLKQVSITGISTEAEPSAQDLADLAMFVRQNKIQYILFESLVSPKLAETLAQETGAKTLVLDPIEGLSNDDLKQGKDYFTQMETNLTNLQTALTCHT